ncbi:MAG: hypothetical protein IT462_12375 [Planctomycetes bacterium]|nr:hypothetical protein [Planctomycetota bacterium]
MAEAIGRFIRMPWDWPFITRLGVLLAVMAVAAASDLAIKGCASQRWREYLLLIGFGCLGAVVGVGNDVVTANLSPDYFVLGKDVRAGADFWPGVLAIATEAGFIAGVVLGGALLLANSMSKGCPPLPTGRIVRFALLPVLAAATGSILGNVISPALPPIEGVVATPLGSWQKSAMHQVRCMHIGLYIGATSGTVLAAVSIGQSRVKLSREQANA